MLCIFKNVKELKTLKNARPNSFLKLTKILKTSQDDVWDKLVNIRCVIEFNVSVAVMYRKSNFNWNSSRMQQAHYFRDINYYKLKN